MDFDSCMEEQQTDVHIESEKRYFSYALFRYSGTQHSELKVDLQNDFTTGNNIYPKSHPQTLHLLDKHINIAVPKIPASKGSPFAKEYANIGNGGRGVGNKRGGDDKT